MTVVKRHHLIVIYSILGTLAVTAAVLFVIAQWLRPVPPLKPNIAKQLNFTAYIAPQSEDAAFRLDSQTVEFATTTKTLTYTARSRDVSVVVTQQALPAPFTDIPNYYETMLNKLHQFKTIQTAVGTVTLTHPDELKGDESAVLNTTGTLLFAHPNKPLSEDEWRRFFRELVVVK